MDDDDEDYEMDEDEDEDDEQETTDEGERTDAATDYGSTFEADSDYTPDEVASVAGMLGELSVPAELQANPAPEVPPPICLEMQVAHICTRSCELAYYASGSRAVVTAYAPGMWL